MTRKRFSTICGSSDIRNLTGIGKIYAERFYAKSIRTIQQILGLRLLLGPHRFEGFLREGIGMKGRWRKILCSDVNKYMANIKDDITTARSFNNNQSENGEPKSTTDKTKKRPTDLSEGETEAKGLTLLKFSRILSCVYYLLMIIDSIGC
ncbi:Oidioi.mRNA.OKI2018_I69.XSR.g16211.t1.cds [Oikopleura dioica]|uniref:Oidioi.mRNA.OKI2018_I69.XSR.g16211.t1.cds n=1 Tax=Oikopleura dioica TaxID=34765 RepID=A0ABN7SFC4_OIKDI|nr:Oidioi.mRNA.OKI2018_I69.XSR.g16211.t1.cds [Oikopleura dioica]